jgi:hypothetical protein
MNVNPSNLKPCDYCMLPTQLVQPLVLSLLQLCSELNPVVGVIVRGVCLVDELLSACLDSAKRITKAAELRHATVAKMPDGMVEVVSGATPVDPQPAAVEMQRAYQQALHAMAQPLLHCVGPAALKAVRQMEQGLSRGVVSSSITVLPGEIAEQAAVSVADYVLGRFGRLVLRVITESEYGSCCCSCSSMLTCMLM